jgi:multidrug resistance efflux pump
MQNLYKEGAVSEQDVESAEVALRAAQASRPARGSASMKPPCGRRRAA